MNIVARAKNMLLTPKTEWDAVAADTATVGSLYSGYIIPFTLIAAACGFIGNVFFATALLGEFGMHFSALYWLGWHVFSWALGLGGIYLSAVIVNALAPSFGSTPNQVNALKLVAFASTAVWTGQLLQIFPVLGGIAVFVGAIYSIYLFYLGVPKLMATPSDKIVMYMIVSAIVMIVISVAISLIVGTIAGGLFVGSAIMGHGLPS